MKNLKLFTTVVMIIFAWSFAQAQNATLRNQSSYAVPEATWRANATSAGNNYIIDVVNGQDFNFSFANNSANVSWTYPTGSIPQGSYIEAKAPGSYYGSFYSPGLYAFFLSVRYVAEPSFNGTPWTDPSLGSGSVKTYILPNGQSQASVSIASNGQNKFLDVIWFKKNGGDYVNAGLNDQATVSLGAGEYKLIAGDDQNYLTTLSFTIQSSQTYSVSLSASPSNGGTVSGGGNNFTSGTQATVSANANSGWHFVNWTENGSPVSTNASYSFTVSGNRTLIANFAQDIVNYTISLSASPSEGGTVTGGGSFANGSQQTVKATANQGWSFKDWTENGSVVSTSASYQFTVNGNRALIANFQATTVPVTSVEISQTSASMQIGGELQLTTTIQPANATNQNVTWSSSNTGVATVDQSGKVKAIAQGNATITVTTVDGNKTATCAVSVSTMSAIPVIDLKGQYVANGQKITIKVIGQGSERLTKIYVNEQLTTELSLNKGVYVVVATNDNGTLRIETVVNVLGQGQ